MIISTVDTVVNGLDKNSQTHEIQENLYGFVVWVGLCMFYVKFSRFFKKNLASASLGGGTCTARLF